jgi:hypothetical protein
MSTYTDTELTAITQAAQARGVERVDCPREGCRGALDFYQVTFQRIAGDEEARGLRVGDFEDWYHCRVACRACGTSGTLSFLERS